MHVLIINNIPLKNLFPWGFLSVIIIWSKTMAHKLAHFRWKLFELAPYTLRVCFWRLKYETRCLKAACLLLQIHVIKSINLKQS